MSTYIDEIEIRHALIKQQFLTDTGQYDSAAFTAEIDFYLNAADNKLVSLVNGRPTVDIADVPTYVDGMHQDLIDLLRYYVYFRFFDDRNIVVVGVNANDRDGTPHRTNSLHFEKHFAELMQGLSDYVLLNDSEDLEDTQLGVGVTIPRSTF